MLCDKCGVTLKVGDWPFCDGDPTKHVCAIGFGEQPLTRYYDHELEAEVSTRGERRSLMGKKGLDYADVSKKRRGKLYVAMHRR